MRKLFFILLIQITIFNIAIGQDETTVADSLFRLKKYTESFELYKSTLIDQRKSSPSMLLKMAFIKEGLGGYSDALYYLNLYYLETADRKVLSKMDELAKKHDLVGYSFSDYEFIQTIFYKNYFYVVVSLFVLSLLLFAFVFHLKIRKHTSPLIPSTFMLVALAILFYVLNFSRNYNKAIINQSNTYLMSGPSAGAEVLKIVSKGNRLSTLGEQDVWTQVEYQNQTGYIKTDKLRKINL
jgi:hypothetical protein